MKATMALVLCLASLGVSFGNATIEDCTSKAITVDMRKNMEATLYIPTGSGLFPYQITHRLRQVDG